jgi:hypothetical protein
VVNLEPWAHGVDYCADNVLCSGEVGLESIQCCFTCVKTAN